MGNQRSTQTGTPRMFGNREGSQQCHWGMELYADDSGQSTVYSTRKELHRRSVFEIGSAKSATGEQAFRLGIV